MTKYVLDENGEPREEPNLLVWGAWFEGSGPQRIVAKSVFEGKDGVTNTISTVFLSIVHPGGIWETMIFPEAKVLDRCFGTRQHALEMHHRICQETKPK